MLQKLFAEFTPSQQWTWDSSIFAGLHSRYHKLRALEDLEELQVNNRKGEGKGRRPRVRFVNYYTLSTSRTKKASASKRKQRATEGQQQSRIVSLHISDISDSETQPGPPLDKRKKGSPVLLSSKERRYSIRPKMDWYIYGRR